MKRNGNKLHAIKLSESSAYNLLIANTGANNAVRSKLGDSHWTLIADDSNGQSDSGSFELKELCDVISDQMENVYVVDSGNHRIQFHVVNQTKGMPIVDITILDSFYSIALDEQHNLEITLVHSSIDSHVSKRINHSFALNMK